MNSKAEVKMKSQWKNNLIIQTKGLDVLLDSINLLKKYNVLLKVAGKVAKAAEKEMYLAKIRENGIEHIATLEAGIKKWMEVNEYKSVQQMKGSMSYKSVSEPSAFARANYMKVVKSYM